MIRLFDTHAHIGLVKSDQMDQLMLVQHAKRAGVLHIVSICNSIYDFEKAYRNLSSAKGVFHAVGLSPTETMGLNPGWEEKVRRLSSLDRVVAIGETGLDYAKMYAPKPTQIEAFVRQLEIARKAGLPVIVHNRAASSDILNILKTRIPPKGAVLHCYSDGPDFARRALNLPIWFSFAGNITYRNVKPLIDTIRMLPMERILVESEAPFMAPARYSRQRNRPEYIIENARAVAMIKDIWLEDCCEALYQNSLRAFGIEEDN